ncbi:retrovirus-related Pol polyprotein from transposon 412 [Trichonephila clavipes]|nr:retrovirus-related Pol polyprotein from transposon 412 [Trichonephila clavipes]
MTVPSIKIAITNSEGYEEEFVKNLYETIIANGKRLEELERAEKKMRLEELERAEKMRLRNFDPKQSDISLYLVIFERQAKRASIEKKEWIQVKSGGLSAKICPTPEKSYSTWKDFTFEITNYLDEWLIGLEINTFQDLKDLMVVDQLKKRANASMKDHFLDNWANLKSATQIAELFDNYEDVRKVNSKPMDRGRNFNTCTPGICSGISAAKGYARKFNQCSKNSEEIKPLYEQAASQVQVTNQVYSLEKELLVKNREDKLGNVVKLIVVPEGLRDPIKSLCHEGTSAHLGITKSKDKLNRYFYWPNCYRDMEQFVKTCDQCQKAGKPNDKKKAPLKLVPVIQEVFTKLNIDACGPLPITSKGNRCLITAICMSSKFPEAIPVSDISSCSDYQFFERFGILVRHSSVYHPQSNPVERFHRTLKRLLRVLCLDAGSEWDKHLPSILLALRTVSHESTGYTPSELVYGKNLPTPETLVMEHWMEPGEEGDLVTEYMFKLINRLKRCQEVAINKMEEMQVKRKTWYDKNAVKREFKDGDLVLVLATSRANKLAVQWIGPGTILNKILETNYLVEIPGRRETSQIYHINMLKPYYKKARTR